MYRRSTAPIGGPVVGRRSVSNGGLKQNPLNSTAVSGSTPVTRWGFTSQPTTGVGPNPVGSRRVTCPGTELRVAGAKRSRRIPAIGGMVGTARRVAVVGRTINTRPTRREAANAGGSYATG